MTEEKPKGSLDVFKRILVATDFSEHSHLAVETAARIGQACELESFVILHVFDVTNLPIIQTYPYYYGKVNKTMVDEIRTRAERALAERARPYISAIPVASARLETGRTPFVILDLAEEMAADLIVLGVAGLGGGRTGMGSTALKVIRRSRCPVMVVQHRPDMGRAVGKDEGTSEALTELLKRDARKRFKKEQKESSRRRRLRLAKTKGSDSKDKGDKEPNPV